MTRTPTLLFLAAFCCLGAQAGDNWVLQDRGIGPVRIGMTLSQLRTTLHEKLAEQESGSDNCFYVTSSHHDQIGFMIIDGKLVRIDVDKPGILTSTGLQVGDSELHARRVYGPGTKVTAHQYVDTGHYLTVKDGEYGIRFETDNGKITRFYAGMYEAIQYVEGCE